jgi:hypothetical protein
MQINFNDIDEMFVDASYLAIVMKLDGGETIKILVDENYTVTLGALRGGHAMVDIDFTPIASDND